MGAAVEFYSNPLCQGNSDQAEDGPSTRRAIRAERYLHVMVRQHGPTALKGTGGL